MTTRVHPLPGPFVIVIFGAGGDLTRRKLIPALHNLYLGNWLPEKFAIIGVDRKNLSDEGFRHNLRAEGVDEFSRRGLKLLKLFLPICRSMVESACSSSAPTRLDAAIGCAGGINLFFRELLPLLC